MINRTRLLALLTIVGTTVTAAGAATDDLSWHTIDGGGGDSSGGDFALRGTAGQPDAGAAMTGGDFALVGGFWNGGGGVTPGECPGDVNGDRLVDFDDLIAVLAAWGACGACPEDLNDDGFVDFDDLLLVLANWGASC